MEKTIATALVLSILGVGTALAGPRVKATVEQIPPSTCQFIVNLYGLKPGSQYDLRFYLNGVRMYSVGFSSGLGKASITYTPVIYNVVGTGTYTVGIFNLTDPAQNPGMTTAGTCYAGDATP